MATENAVMDIEALASGQFEHAKVSIVIPQTALPAGQTGTITGFTIENFSIQGSASWEGKAIGENSMLDGVANTLGMAGNSVGLTNVGQVSTTSRASTVRRWTSSEPAQFPINFVLVAYKDDIDVRRDVSKLLRCVYPLGNAGEGFGVGVGMRAPMGYIAKAGEDDTAENTATLKIGRWFRADGLLIEDVVAEFSKEVTPQGNPLYANVTATFIPYRMLYADDVTNLFYGEG
ncbi:MAG: hypothetical protein GY833_12400 [Aestuariibacter sp.]|nr:hypothetical protein [Aestuariibacter sp.]|tara:strand:+ start:77427 stop:78122 length:696 start_codon:yes stop_codon:yes gene_type:complete